MQEFARNTSTALSALGAQARVNKLDTLAYILAMAEEEARQIAEGHPDAALPAISPRSEFQKVNQG